MQKACCFNSRDSCFCHTSSEPTDISAYYSGHGFLRSVNLQAIAGQRHSLTWFVAVQRSLRKASDIRVLARNILSGNLQPLPSDVSPACVSLITDLLQRNPSDRPHACDISAHPWLQSETESPSEKSLLEACMTAQARAQALAGPEVAEVELNSPPQSPAHGHKSRRHRWARNRHEPACLHVCIKPAA